MKVKLFTVKTFSGFYGIEEEEANRALLAYKNGESIIYENGEEYIEIDQSGTMYVKGFKRIGNVFVAFAKSDGEYKWLDIDATYHKKIKALVKKVVFEEGIEWIGYACKDCVNLTTAVIPDTVTAIYNTFEGCNKLKPYTLPSALDTISGQIFGIYPEKVVLPDGIDNINSVFSNSPIKSITLPKSLKRIDYRGLSYCKELEEIIFKEGIEALSSEALANNPKLNNVVLPRSLDYIGEFAFAGCSSLTDITFLGDTYAEKTAFDRTPCQNQVNRLLFNQTEAIEFGGRVEDIKDYQKLFEMQKGKTLLEQSENLIVYESGSSAVYSYGDLDYERCRDNAKSLADATCVEKLILKDGVIVGIVVKGKNVLAGENICVYFAVDEDGTGRECVEDYCALIIKE